MKITNKIGLSQVWTDAVTYDDYDKAGWRSATGLIAPVQQQILLQQHDHEVTEDVSGRIWMLLGSAIHNILERAAKMSNISTVLTEERFTIDILGKEISLKPDRVEPILETDPIEYHLKDFKIAQTGAFTYGLNDSWKKQGNIYAYALRRIGINVTRISIEVLCKNWSFTEYQIESTKAAAEGIECKYPASCIGAAPVEVWSDEECLQYLEERVTAYIEAEELGDDDLPECSEEERWVSKSQFKVFKKGNKKASKGKLDTRAEAEAWIKDKKATAKTKAAKNASYFVQYCPGESIRCERYCSVKQWCHQYNTEINPPF